MTQLRETSRGKQNEWDAFWAEQPAPYKGDVTSARLLKMVRKYVGEKALDIGAGSGALIRAFEDSFNDGATIVGVDSSPRSPDVTTANATSLPFGDGAFDTVFMTDIVEHLDNEVLTKALAEAKRVLRPGGHIVISTVNDEDLKAQHVRCPACAHWFHRWGHCRTFTPASLSHLLNGCGFV